MVLKRIDDQTIIKLQMNMKINWSVIKKIIQLIITILTSVVGTLAVQSCMSV
jgi:hypothetical protein